MKEKEGLKALYFYEQNLLKSSAAKLIESSNDVVHDNVLSIFDNIDEINRCLYSYLLSKNLVSREKTTRQKKENLYEELDELLLRINE